MQTSIKKESIPKADIFVSSSLTTGYFYTKHNNQDQEDHQQYPHYSEEPTSHQQLIDPPQSSRRRTKITSHSTPQKQPQNVQETQDQTNNQNSAKKSVKGHHRRTYKKATNKRNIQELENELETLDDVELQKHDQVMLSKESVQNTDRGVKEKAEEVFQLDDLEAEFQVEQAVQKVQQNSKSSKRPTIQTNKRVKQQVVFQQSSDEQGESPQRLQAPNLLPLSSQSSLSHQKQPTLTQNTSQFTQRPPQVPKTEISKEHMFKILTYPVKQNMVMRTNLERVNGFIFNPYPEYHLYFQSDKIHLLSAKRVSKTPFSTFVISRNKNDFTQNSQDYLGKAKGSAIGDELNLYGKGFSPANALIMKVKPRQLLATIVYETRIILAGQPRNFKVYIKKPDVDYYQSFPEVKIYGEQIPLHLLYQNPHNRQHIIVLQNKKPQYHPEIKGYSLNFRGRVGLASVKNFVLEKVPDQIKKQTTQQSQENAQKSDIDTMIFGKAKDNTFNMDLSTPLSPLIAFGIALSTFDEKYFCE